MKRLLIISLLLAGCASEEEICAQKFAKLDSLRNETRANLFRQWSECRAQQIEFGNVEIVGICMETYRAMEEVARGTVASLDKRMDDPDMVRCAALQKPKQAPGPFNDLLPATR